MEKLRVYRVCAVQYIARRTINKILICDACHHQIEYLRLAMLAAITPAHMPHSFSVWKYNPHKKCTEINKIADSDSFCEKFDRYR